MYDDNKQEILELKPLMIFSESLDDPAFGLVVILKSINKMFENKNFKQNHF